MIPFPAAASSRSTGFTLIELLVVMLIIGILATFVSLSIGDRALDDQLETQGRRLHTLLDLASEEAELRGLELGFLLRPDGYSFLELGPEGQWTPLTEHDMFRPRPMKEPFYLELRVEGRSVPPADPEAEELAPQVLLLSSGERSPFTLDVRARGHRPYYRISGDAVGRIDLERREDKA